MRVPLSWLREFVDVQLSPERLADRLTLLGMEVSAIERIGSDWQRVVVGELLEVGPHPASGKLSLTRVRVGPDGKELLHRLRGHQHPRRPARARRPAGRPPAGRPPHRGLHHRRRRQRGHALQRRRAGLTGDADGILILPAEAPLGLDLAELAGDVVLDVDVKPNRGDALSILGLAREVSAVTGAPLVWPDLSVDESGDATADHLSVEVEEPELCTRFVGRYVEGVSVGPSPWDVQRRLIAAGVRPVSNVVDASNHVLMELGKPIHTFDAEGVRGGRIVVRRARPGERLETLDHVVRPLSSDTLLIADPAGPLALAGVMGGAASEVTEATRNVIVESAIFDPVSVRRTAFRYGLRSEASLRFEKGQEHGMALAGADRTAALILRWAGGRAAVGVVDTQPREPDRVRIAFRPARVNRLLGEDIPVGEQRALLARVGVGTEAATTDDAVPIIAGEAPLPLGPAAGEALVAIVPAHRRDLAIEADISEEVARVRGYETLASRLPDTSMPHYRPDPRRLVDGLRAALSGAGLVEVVTHGLIGPDDHALLGHGDDDAGTIRAANPVTIDHSELRRSLLPGHLRVIAENERQRSPDIHAFEVGAVHAWAEGLPIERHVLGLVLCGRDRPPAPDRRAEGVDVAGAKGLLELLASRFTSSRLAYEAVGARPGVEHPGRTAAVVAVSDDAAGTVVGRVGELHPRLLAAYGVRASHVVFAEVDIDALASLVPERRRVGDLEHLPGIERDIAVVVATRHAAGLVEALIRAHGGEHLRGVRLFDEYRGAPLGDDERSLAYRLRFEAVRELREEDVDDAVERVVAVLSERLGAHLRH